jgi:hypothetical protein
MAKNKKKKLYFMSFQSKEWQFLYINKNTLILLSIFISLNMGEKLKIK